jgi:hypothetical protein
MSIKQWDAAPTKGNYLRTILRSGIHTIIFLVTEGALTTFHINAYQF